MKRFRAAIGLALASLSLSLATEARADVNCTFSIAGVSLTPDGTLAVNFTSSSVFVSWYLCSVSGSTTVNNGYGSVVVSSNSCMALYSTFLTLRMSNRTINAYMHTSDCTAASLTAGGVPNPYPMAWGY